MWYMSRSSTGLPLGVSVMRSRGGANLSDGTVRSSLATLRGAPRLRPLRLNMAGRPMVMTMAVLPPWMT
jgi:hypothetical protein